MVAQKKAQHLQDEYVSVEHLIVAIASIGGICTDLLKRYGITADKLLAGMKEIRGAQRVTDPNPEVQLALRLLRQWDGFLTTDSVGGAVYEVFRYTLVRNLLEPSLGPDLSNRLMGKGFPPLLNHSNEFFGHDTVVLIRILDQPDSWWVHQAGGHDVLLSKSLTQSIKWLQSTMGNDDTLWQWGKIHQVNFEHALSLQNPFDQVFDRGPYSVGGDTDTPLQTAMKADDPYNNKAWSPVFRQIVDMGDLSRSLTIAPPGQSGHLSSHHYDDLIQPWLDGVPHPMLWTREQVEVQASDKLILESGS